MAPICRSHYWINVRYGSKADVTLLNINVYFTPESGHSMGCLFIAIRRSSGRSQGSGMTSRRFPPPWSVEDIGGSFVVRASNDRPVVFIYYRENVGRRSLAKILTRNAARKMRQGSPSCRNGLYPPAYCRLLQPMRARPKSPDRLGTHCRRFKPDPAGGLTGGQRFFQFIDSEFSGLSRHL
jgi:hypothetical protein